MNATALPALDRDDHPTLLWFINIVRILLTAADPEVFPPASTQPGAPRIPTTFEDAIAMATEEHVDKVSVIRRGLDGELEKLRTEHDMPADVLLLRLVESQLAGDEFVKKALKRAKKSRKTA